MKLGIKIYADYKISITDLNGLGIKIHKSFLKKNWLKLIPNNFINENKLYEGICFSEEAKVAFVLPRNTKIHKKLIEFFNKQINKNLSKKYSIVKGDDVFLQISRSFKIDPKFYALKTIIKKLSLKDEQVAVFGNMPEDNDQGILINSKLPFTFTNSKSVHIIKRGGPPYYINNEVDSKVNSIHNFVIKSLQ